MIENAPFLTEKFGGFTVEGYSRAAVQSYWRIPELKMGFDLGAHPWDFMGTSRWAITHSHLDHIAALPVYIARRRMMKMDPPTVYLPAGAVDAVEGMLRTFSRLDRGRLPVDLVAVAPGDEIKLSREILMTVHKTVHTVPSVGYVLWERRTKLKPEYVGLSGPEIRDLRMSGTEVSAETRIPVVAYTGDTSPKGLEQNADFLKAKILITEMTFVAPQHRKEKIHKHGHMHLDDFVFNRQWFENDHVIASHFSVRYSGNQIRKMVQKRIPGSMGESATTLVRLARDRHTFAPVLTIHVTVHAMECVNGYNPQSNGKPVCFHGILKDECIRPGQPETLEEVELVVHRLFRNTTKLECNVRLAM